MLMRTRLSPGRRTDLGILQLQGADIADRGDHLVVRSPRNPLFHWGNFVLVTSGDPSDADRWLSVFAAEFPEAEHIAIDLPELPDDVAAYAAHGVGIDTDDVLTSTNLPQLRPLPDGYAVHQLLSDDDWEQVVGRNVAENNATGEHEPVGYERFSRDQAAHRRALVADGDAAFFGAFAGAELVADLGIVLLDDGARYQSVGTAAEHRRKGLAGHLLGVAARWAGERGAGEWVIVTESTNPAGRLYRSLGFAGAAQNVRAYRSTRPR
ncbi:N-acetyltransferase [Flexivirga endophytica]|uniref:N-acetyltransferase n=2 Tax=Flexivirga endophytica TaxID=1849103 RepID=A0A916X0D0_9MICO|nr:N-acetyltransferase [Flexivirga endophytica]GHB60962.1 N-acetyltransferase [Flexivirga endophytica]